MKKKLLIRKVCGYIFIGAGSLILAWIITLLIGGFQMDTGKAVGFFMLPVANIIFGVMLVKSAQKMAMELNEQ